MSNSDHQFRAAVLDVSLPAIVDDGWWGWSDVYEHGTEQRALPGWTAAERRKTRMVRVPFSGTRR